MRSALIILGVLAGGLICFTGYCAALIDWVQDYRAGVYSTHYLEAFLETMAILLYSYVGWGFFKRKIDLLA